jgi:hypothetical protein
MHFLAFFYLHPYQTVLEYICKEQIQITTTVKNIKVKATVKTNSGTLNTIVTVFKDSSGSGGHAKGVAKISGKMKTVYSSSRYDTTWFTESERV